MKTSSFGMFGFDSNGHSLIGSLLRPTTVRKEGFHLRSIGENKCRLSEQNQSDKRMGKRLFSIHCARTGIQRKPTLTKNAPARSLLLGLRCEGRPPADWNLCPRLQRAARYLKRLRLVRAWARNPVGRRWVGGMMRMPWAEREIQIQN